MTEGVHGMGAKAGAYVREKTLYMADSTQGDAFNWESLNASNKWNAYGIDWTNVVAREMMFQATDKDEVETETGKGEIDEEGTVETR